MIADQATALRGLMMQQAPAPGSDPGSVPDASHPAGGSPRARTIAITSGKGGVGKTSVSVNLAIQLARAGRKVILLDADLGTANVDVLLNLAPAATLAHVVTGRRRIEDTLIPAPGGFHVIPGASGLAQMANLSEFERARLVQEMRKLETRADVILIDTGAGVGANVLSFCIAADETLVITTPEPTAITDAYALTKSLVRQQTGLDLRLLVNQVRDEREGRAVFDRMAAVAQRFLNVSPRYAGFVPADPKVPAAVRQRRPFVLESPHAPASLCLNQLAQRMDRHATPESPGGGVFRRMATWWSTRP